MFKINKNYSHWIILISVLLLMLFIVHFILYDDILDKWIKRNNLQKDGFCIFKNVLSKKEIEELKEQCSQDRFKEVKTMLMNHEKLDHLIKKNTGIKYQFQDYIFIIKKSSIHTCHRDSNGDFFNEGQKYSSYTMLIFLEKMDKCLGVIPGSHKDINSFNINTSDKVVNLLCNPGDMILFNANLIHVGALNDKDDHVRIQMKVTHKDDIDKIAYYQNFNKVLNKENTMPMHIRKAQKNLSCMFPGFSNLTQSENIRTSRGTDNGANIGIVQKWFSYLFYGDVDFYDLPNAF
jgi:hypothetical protein